MGVIDVFKRFFKRINYLIKIGVIEIFIFVFMSYEIRILNVKAYYIPHSFKSILKKIQKISVINHSRLKYLLIDLMYILKKKEPILIYQMGRVGSRSIYNSLYLMGIGPLFHLHYIYPPNIKELVDDYLKNNGPRPYNPKISLLVYKNLIKKKRKIKIITLVREPISQNISAFFKVYVGKKFEDSNLDINKLINFFNRRYDRHNRVIDWFDKEFKKTTGIDVYQYSFPKEKGYQIITKGSIDVLILKLECNDDFKKKAISNFLELNRDFKLISVNVSNSKMYSEFNRNINFEHSYLNRMFNSKYIQHFYTKEEIEEFYLKWSK